MRTCLPLLLLMACGGEPDCDSGFTAVDGLCYEDQSEIDEWAAFEAYFEALPACEADAPGNSDLHLGCIEGQCIGSGTFGALAAALSMTPDNCVDYGILAYCDIPDYSLQFYDADSSGGLTDGDTLDGFTVTDGSARSAEGWGVGSSLDCYVSALDLPDYATFDPLTETLTDVEWGTLALRVDSGLVTGIDYRP
ncbi:MAG: hypothetical protein EP330_26955 [Deltaproteobacteria bacterium]|nr:MAG: hypothetical protein EP330_26955 [Deltaproteobacteria bacterium]